MLYIMVEDLVQVVVLVEGLVALVVVVVEEEEG